MKKSDKWSKVLSGDYREIERDRQGHLGKGRRAPLVWLPHGPSVQAGALNQSCNSLLHQESEHRGGC